LESGGITRSNIFFYKIAHFQVSLIRCAGVVPLPAVIHHEVILTYIYVVRLVLVFSSDEARLIDRTLLFDYYFRWEGNIKEGGSGVIAFGLISLCSHSPTPNAIVQPNYHDNTLELYATVDIAAGEEITIRASQDVELMALSLANRFRFPIGTGCPGLDKALRLSKTGYGHRHQNWRIVNIISSKMRSTMICSKRNERCVSMISERAFAVSEMTRSLRVSTFARSFNSYSSSSRL
jgi:SET domain